MPSPELTPTALPVESIGSGTDLVLLHGWGLHSEFFRPWLPLLAPHCRVHLIDLPGHGLSPDCTPYSLEAMALAVARAMQPLSRRYAVAGWSLGGAVALRLALDHPGAVSHVVTLASSPRFLRMDGWAHATMPHALELLRAGLARDYAATGAQFFELNLAAKYRGLSDELAVLAKRRPAPSATTLNHGVALTSGVDLRAEVARIQAPLLAISGRLDRLSYSQSSAWLADATGGTHIDMAHAAHAPHLSNGAECAEAIIQHLSAGSST
jgi:pimeloyl-[acyl-carrier protein] methyl ester esterase